MSVENGISSDTRIPIDLVVNQTDLGRAESSGIYPLATGNETAGTVIKKCRSR
jgi:hypothetical protein